MSPAITPHPRIVVLDGHTMNHGDLDWRAIEALGELTIHERTSTAEIVRRAAGADIPLTNKTPITAETIAALPRLRFIGVLATGCNVVDTAAAKTRGIPVCNVPGYGTASVAQHVFALLLELTQRAGHHAQTVREGRWNACPDFCYWDFPLIELAGHTLGIVGCGSIGEAVARIGIAFGMKVIASARRLRTAEGVEFVSTEEIFRRADVVTLHCPLTDETRGLVNGVRIATMKAAAARQSAAWRKALHHHPAHRLGHTLLTRAAHGCGRRKSPRLPRRPASERRQQCEMIFSAEQPTDAHKTIIPPMSD